MLKWFRLGTLFVIAAALAFAAYPTFSSLTVRRSDVLWGGPEDRLAIIAGGPGGGHSLDLFLDAPLHSVSEDQTTADKPVILSGSHQPGSSQPALLAAWGNAAGMLKRCGAFSKKIAPGDARYYDFIREPLVPLKELPVTSSIAEKFSRVSPLRRSPDAVLL